MTTPPPELIRKAHDYVKNGVKMFVARKNGERSHPPPWATLEQVTTLPWTVGEDDVILRFDAQNPTKKRHWKSFQTFKELVDEFGTAPPVYFVTMHGDRDKFKEENVAQQ